MFNHFVVTAMGYSYLPSISPSVENLFFFIIGVTVFFCITVCVDVEVWSGQGKQGYSHTVLGSDSTNGKVLKCQEQDSYIKNWCSVIIIIIIILFVCSVYFRKGTFVRKQKYVSILKHCNR